MRRVRNISQVILPLSILALVLAVQTTALPTEAHAPGVVLSALGTATIDGVMSPGEWDEGDGIDFAVNVPEGGTTPGRVWAMNDADNLYLAIRFARSVVDPGNSAAFEFDNDDGGAPRVSGDDVLLVNPSIGFYDEVRWLEPPCPPGVVCGLYDTDLGGTNDGAGAFANDGTFTVYEFSHPLDSLDDAHDFSLSPGDTVGFHVFIRMMAEGVIADTSFPAQFDPNHFGDIVIVSPVIPVDIDVKPGSDPNSVNCYNENGVIAVGILTTDDFDATTVDHTTVTFEGASETHVDRRTGEPRRHEEDADGDGDIDLVFHFRLGDTNLTCDSVEGTLTGETFDGQPIIGSDSIRMLE